MTVPIYLALVETSRNNTSIGAEKDIGLLTLDQDHDEDPH
jgi:hypothetical protein